MDAVPQGSARSTGKTFHKHPPEVKRPEGEGLSLGSVDGAQRKVLHSTALAGYGKVLLGAERAACAPELFQTRSQC